MDSNTRIYGQRNIWPGKTFHWEIRKGVTLREYNSPQFQHLLRVQLEMFEKDKRSINQRERVNSGFDVVYEMSCLKMLEDRFSYYESILPAKSYRRTSFNFDMKGKKDLGISAFVEKVDPETVWMTYGLVLAIEDACHTIFAMCEKPIGLYFNENLFDRLDLRALNRSNVQAFTNYSFDKDSHKNPIRGTIVPKSIYDFFYSVSLDVDRQTFADHLSTASLLWVIGHEDAHKYSGHIKLFNKLGISEDDKLFSELIAFHTPKINPRHRRAAELESDTCSTMRLIDYCFDNEYLGIITDDNSNEIKNTIWQGRKESEGLEKEQRLFLMRFLNISAIVPLVIFDVSFRSKSYNSLDSYPSFITRALNIMFTVAGRSMSVSVTQFMQKVGTFELTEFLEFFKTAFFDILEVYNLISSIMTGKSHNLVDEIGEDVDVICNNLFLFLLGYHNQMGLVEFYKMIYSDSIKTKSAIVNKFIEEKLNMNSSIHSYFFDSKLSINMARADKVIADKETAISKVRVINYFIQAVYGNTL